MKQNNLIRDLGGGLILRRSTSADAEVLAHFNKTIHGEGDWDEKGLEEWTLDLISGESPTFDVGDFTIVEDTLTGEIVSTCCLISQTWSYEGIPFKVGRPELVATKKEYRRRGLVREQFAVLHEWSQNRGELVQAITGIPYYYRQFGYEMTLNLEGGRKGYDAHVPQLIEDEKETFTFRQANPDDIPFLMSTYNHGCKRSMISAVWDESLWRYELAGKRKYNIDRREIFIIEDPTGTPVGFIGIPPIKWRDNSALTLFEIVPGASWSAITPSVIRFLWQKGEELGKEQNQKQKSFSFWLGESHPAYEVMASKMPFERKPYAFYIRVPDLVGFINKISPVLEKRLARSAFASFSGEIELCFYRDGLCLTFEDGFLKEVKTSQDINPEKASACFPPLVFLHLLFGYRTMEELNHAFTDCSAKDDQSKNLLNALFPRKPSDIWPIA